MKTIGEKINRRLDVEMETLYQCLLELRAELNEQREPMDETGEVITLRKIEKFGDYSIIESILWGEESPEEELILGKIRHLKGTELFLKRAVDSGERVQEKIVSNLIKMIEEKDYTITEDDDI